jgi:hypothetical protein
MKKVFAVLALALTLAVGIAAKTHRQQQEPSQEKAVDTFDTNAWRHFLLSVPEDRPGGDKDSPVHLGGDLLTILTTMQKFRREFEEAIDQFNVSQETRIESDELSALKDFIVRRDAMVESYRKQLMSALGPEGQALVVEILEFYKPMIKSYAISSSTGENCGLPNQFTCSITYSFRPTGGGFNEVGQDMFGSTQILDGVVTMFGNPPHARHTPTVTLVGGGKQQSSSGKSVCADCYLYVNSTMSFPGVEGVQYEVGHGGSVACSETGKFFETDASSE